MIRVLYVDDEKHLLELAKEFLELSLELQVDTCLSVKDAEVMLRQTAYDAIISDYQMPITNGIEFLKRLRSRNNPIPFILFTGRGREEVVMEALNSGADFYVQKGGNPVALFIELEHKVREAVRRRRAEKALQENEWRLSRAQAIGSIGSWELTWCGDRALIWGSEESYRIFGQARPNDGVATRDQVVACIPEYERVHQALVDLIEKGKEYDLEFEIVPADGRPKRIIHSVGELVRDMEGRPLKVLGMIQDITERKRTEEALQESKRALRSVLDNIPQGVEWKDRDLRIIGGNRQAAQEMGLSSTEELIGRMDREFLSPASAERNDALDRQVLETGVPLMDFEEWVVSAKGILRCLRVSKVPLRDPAGEVIGIMDTWEDITSRKRTEEALQESRERYSRLIEAIPDWLVETDLEGVITSVNSRVIDMSGYTREELIGKSIFSFLAPEYVEEAIKNTAAMQEGALGPKKYDLIMKDGSRATFEANGDLMRGADGSVQGVVLVGRNITKHEEVERELRENKLQLTMAMEMTKLAHWEYDIRSDMYVFNDQFYALYGTTAEREGGYRVPRWRYIRDFIHPDDTVMVNRMFEEEARIPDNECRIKSHVHRIVRRDGEVRYIVVSVCRVVEGNHRKVFGVNQDITELKMAEDGLRRANEKLNLLNGINRHDILNQLMVQRSHLELAMRQVSDVSVRSRLKKIDESIDIVQKQIEFTRDYEQLGAASPQWQSVWDILSGLPDLERLERLELDDRMRHLRVWADPMLARVFHNLVENSIRHCGRPAEIRIGCEESDKGLLLVFEDKGYGIPDDEKDKIFCKGFGKGTGLGLFFSKEILAITGITIHETGRPGEGVRFEMLIPRGRYLLAEGPAAGDRAPGSGPEVFGTAS
jgi:PAS domain S-box-containing protein